MSDARPTSLEMHRIAVLMTCFNRKAKTLECLARLQQCQLPGNYSISVFLVDDASPDGTYQAVRESFPSVRLIHGTGQLYWNGGMRVAFEAAMLEGFDFYLWLNDDTLLYPPAIHRMLTTYDQVNATQGKSAIIVGSTRDVATGALTYGGAVRLKKWKPTSFSLIEPQEFAVECETMNGNAVLVPAEIATALGGMEKRFVHAMGDQDFGLRARDAGFSVWVMPGYAGTCSRNAINGSFNDVQLPLSERWKKILSPKGLPLVPWGVFTRRHAGLAWPIFWLWPYFRLVATGLLRR